LHKITSMSGERPEREGRGGGRLSPSALLGEERDASDASRGERCGASERAAAWQPAPAQFELRVRERRPLASSEETRYWFAPP